MSGPVLPTVAPDRVAIYIRWSTEDQSDGTTLEVQHDACSHYLHSQGWRPAPDLIFVDDGYSGATLDRPALTRLRAAVAAGQVQCVVVYKLDRLSRSVADMVQLVCREWEGRCFVQSAREPVDTTTHAGRMFFYTLVNFAEWERAVIRERTQAGKLRRAQEGRNPGMRPPFGYRLRTGGTFALDPAEAAIVRRIYQLYQRGLGCRAIVGELAAAGARPRGGGAWSQSTVAKILRNPIYCGTLVYGRSGGAPAIVRPGAVPAIIPRARWTAVQTLKQTRPGFGRNPAAGSGRSQYSTSLLTGLLRCRCGHAMGGTAVGRRVRYRYYYCLGRVQKGGGHCGCGRIRQHLLDEQVIDALRRRYGAPAARQALLERVRADLRNELGAARAALSVLEREDRRLRAAAGRLGRLLRDGRLTPAEYRALQSELQQDKATLAAQRERACSRARQLQAALAQRTALAAALARVDVWDTLALADRKRVLAHLVQRAVAYREPATGRVRCEIVWRSPGPARPTPAPAPSPSAAGTRGCCRNFAR